jgi:oxygen-independent coproporphyrinogen-3 oxidase
VDATGLRATDRGRLLLRIIAACFDQYLHLATAEAPRFSKAI